jgi:hypothetical protein
VKIGNSKWPPGAHFRLKNGNVSCKKVGGPEGALRGPAIPEGVSGPLQQKNNLFGNS